MASPSPFDRLRLEGGLCPFPGWGLLRVSGGDRERFLHSQLTSDLRALGDGGSQLSALLDVSGRLRSVFFLHRRPNSFLLLAPDELLSATQETLETRIIADDVAIEMVGGGDMRLALGPLALEVLPRLPHERSIPLTIYAQRGFVTWDDTALSIPPVEASLLEPLGLLSGLPRWGVNVREGQLVNETVLMSTAVSRDKGCYLGQETVAKIDTRRGAAYASMLLRVANSIADPAGQDFEVAGRRGGRVLAAAEWQGETLLEVLLFRDFRVPGRLLVCTLDDGAVLEARVGELPALHPPEPADLAAEIWRSAVARFAADDEDAAIALLEAAIVVCPEFGDAYESLGVIRGRRGELDLGIELMQRLADADPHSVMAHANLSRFYAQLGRIEEAEDELQLASAAAVRGRRKPIDHDESARPEGEEAERVRREALLRRVLEVDPDDAVANFGLGEILLEKGSHEEAAAHFERAIASDPSHSAAYLALGVAFEGVGRHAAADETWRRGVEIAAGHGDLGVAEAIQTRLNAPDCGVSSGELAG